MDLPCADPAPEAAHAEPSLHSELDAAPSRDADHYILHVHERVELNLPVVTRVAPAPAAEAHCAKHRLVVYLILLVRRQAVIQKLP